jgi:hypothetical protein
MFPFFGHLVFHDNLVQYNIIILTCKFYENFIFVSITLSLEKSVCGKP